jgi:hypothetical protein
MSLDMQMRAAAADALDANVERELESIWVENLVAGTGVAIAVLFVSSLAVVMYLA